MVKEGPCCHCGVENTPLWRNGPASKPVLCNACGSRWRTRGTLNAYVPKHALSPNTQVCALPATGYPNHTDIASTDDADTAGPSVPNFKNVPRRRRSNLDQLVLTPMERLHKQLYDIVHEEPEVFMKNKVIDDVLINKVDNRMSTQPETALGAMLLNSPDPGESVSSSSMKLSDASTSPENGANGGESTSTENGVNSDEQGESSYT